MRFLPRGPDPGAWPSRPRVGPLARPLGLIAIAASALVVGGCGSSAVNTAIEQSAQASCLAATGSIKNPMAKQAADQACHAVGSGNTNQLAHAAIQAARLACLQASQQIPDPTARSAAKAACPSGK